MSAPSLYRRHRPRSFDDVVGQEHVVRTLRNAIDQDKVHHAYLFVGSRGTGKTSMAKILAACLNCQGDPDLAATERHVGPTTHPCGRCESCRSIAEATSIDVVEMDAASNNSVDDIRDLRDSVAFSPVGGRHKVYILDEAHMLSSAAWNAFLKTLEEPPPRTIFVLATTEANKVLPTVVDRCHRFDFHRPTPDQLARVLDRVAQQESITVGPEAVSLIARHATGSFRDALGTLEQLVTYAGDTIANEDVLSVLGVADAELLFRALDAVGAGDPAAALAVASELSAQGRDLVQVTRDIEAHARALLLVLMTGALPDELRLSPDRDARTVEQARTLTGAAVIRVLDLIAAALAAVRDGADPRTQLELLLVRAAVPQLDPAAKALAARIARLEQALAAGAAGAAAPVAGSAPGAAQAPVAGSGSVAGSAPGSGSAPAAGSGSAAGSAPAAAQAPAAVSASAPAPAVAVPAPAQAPAPDSAPTSAGSGRAGQAGPAAEAAAGSGSPAAAVGENMSPSGSYSTTANHAASQAAPPVENMPPSGSFSTTSQPATAPGDGPSSDRPSTATPVDRAPHSGALSPLDVAAPAEPILPTATVTPSAQGLPPATAGDQGPTDVPPPAQSDPRPSPPSSAPTAPLPATTAAPASPAGAPQPGAPHAGAPQPGAPHAGASQPGAPQPSAPATPAAPASAPQPGAPASPAQASPAQASPAQASPAQASPAQATPAQATPAQATPAQATPAQAPPAPQPAPPAPQFGVGPTDIDELLPSIADQMPGNAVRAALGQAQTVSVSGVDLVLGLPAGKGSAARLLNREDAKVAIATALEELLGVRYVVRAEERAGMQAAEEPLLPEDEVVRRVLAEFEAEEVGDGASGVASAGVDESSSEAANPSTNGES